MISEVQSVRLGGRGRQAAAWELLADPGGVRSWPAGRAIWRPAGRLDRPDLGVPGKKSARSGTISRDQGFFLPFLPGGGVRF